MKKLIINQNERKLIAWNEAQAGRAKQITSCPPPWTLSDHLITASWLEPCMVLSPLALIQKCTLFNFVHVNSPVDFSRASCVLKVEHVP